MTVDVAGAVIPQWTLADKLRKAREHAGLDQATLAHDLGIARQTVGNYEAERVTPRRSVLMAWALRTGVSLAWLTNDESPRQGGPGGGSQAGLPRLDSNQQPSGYSDAQVIELRPAMPADEDRQVAA
jgi:DNA-binding XRE family transcriptional regulator